MKEAPNKGNRKRARRATPYLNYCRTKSIESADRDTKAGDKGIDRPEKNQVLLYKSNYTAKDRRQKQKKVSQVNLLLYGINDLILTHLILLSKNL